MSSTLKVNGLTYRTIERDVERIFNKFGKINEVFIPKDRFSGKSKGFAFVRFINRDDAKDAFDDQNGRIHDGRRITIEWSRKDDGHERRAEKARGRTRSRTPPRRRSRSGGRNSRRSRSRSIRRDRVSQRSGSRDRRQSPPPERRRSPERSERRPDRGYKSRSRSFDRRRY